MNHLLLLLSLLLLSLLLSLSAVLFAVATVGTIANDSTRVSATRTNNTSHGLLNSTTDDPTPTLHIFVASHEWKELRPDEAVPPGLEIRIDMSTGERMARLPPKTRGGEFSNAIGVHVGAADQAQLSYDPSYDSPKSADLSRQERALHHLGRKLAKMMAPDVSEIIRENLVVLREPLSSVQDALEVLENLEDILHDTDNAANFVSMNGLGTLLDFVKYPHNALSSTRTTHGRLEELELQNQALWTLGTCAQNHPIVQRHLLRAGVVPWLINFVNSSAALDHAESHSKHEQLTRIGRTKALFALGSMLQSTIHSAESWHQVLMHGGMDVFHSLLVRCIGRVTKQQRDETVQPVMSADVHKLLVKSLRKTMSIIHSALMEIKINWPFRITDHRATAEHEQQRDHTSLHSPQDLDVSAESTAMINDLQDVVTMLSGELHRKRWCEVAVSAMDVSDHDLFERALDIMFLVVRGSIVTECAQHLRDHRETFMRLTNALRRTDADVKRDMEDTAEHDDSWPSELAQRLDNLNSILHPI